MTYSDYVIEKSGAKSLRIVVPCFSGEEDFSFCARMNSFYESAVGRLYAYALSLLETAERRARFSCTYEVAEQEDSLNVILHLSYNQSGRRSMRKTLSHEWKRGNVVSRTVG